MANKLVVCNGKGSAVLLLFLVIQCICTQAQQPTVLGTQAVNGTYSTYNLNVVGGFKQIRLQAAISAGASERNWEFAIGTAAAPNYTNNWRPTIAGQLLSSFNNFVPPAIGNASAWYNTGSGGASGLLPAMVAGHYYTFNIGNNNAAANNMAILETSYNPETINTVTRTPANVGAATGATINITTSAVPQANIYVRYANNAGFTGSNIVQASFIGTNGTAQIPAQASGTSIFYYVYSSPVSKAVIDADAGIFGEAVHDMYTLNLNNNAGANYNYTVLPISVTATNTVNDGGYANMGAAFTAINGGIHTGVINILVAGNTAEAAAAVLNGGAYTSVSIQPFGNVARTISGNISGNTLLHFNGADNISIDGLNANGNSLTISNSSTAGAGTATLRFNNASNNNSVQNCTIEGSATSGSDGTIAIGSGTNSNITISNNTIAPAGANLPTTAITGNGTSNTAIVISNNLIQDYYNANANSAGINANNGTDSWQITGNRFFQTATRTATTGNIHRAIQVTNGGGHTIADNIIGYANSSGTGTTTYNGAVANRFVGIELAGNTTVSSIQNNTIAGISVSTSSAATTSSGIFSAIFVSAGSVNIGTLVKNNIGIPVSGPIGITITASGGIVNGITVNSSSNVTCNNNAIAAFTTTSAPAGSAHSFYGIQFNSSGTSNFICNGNSIGGGISIANSATGICNAVGIFCAGSSTSFNIGSINSPNIISGISLNTSTASATICAGIQIANTGGTVNVTGNRINNISSSGINADGIRLTSSAATVPSVAISNNTINTISSTGNFSTISGVNNTTSNGGTNIIKNKIYDLSGNGANAAVNGVVSGNGGSNTTPLNIINNLIGDLRTPSASANTPIAVQGISINTTGSILVNVYYNTVYLTGTSTGANFSATALYSRTEPNLTLRNNALVNLATPRGTGRAMAFERNAVSLLNYNNASNNNLYFTGTPSATNLIFYDGTNSDQTLAAFQARVGAPRDVASVTQLPPFLSTIGSNSEFLHIDASVASLLENGAVNIAGITDDTEGDTRQGNAGYTGSGLAPDIGADEFEACSNFNFRWLGTTSADWHNIANWCTNTLPTSVSNVVIPSGTPFSPNIANADAVAMTVTLNSGAILTLSNTRNLTISVAGDFTNNGGSFVATGSGAVIFAGSGGVAGTGASTFQNMTVNGAVNLLTIPTITGNLQLNNGGSITSSPIYGSSATLIYNTGTTTTTGDEWLAGISTGAGVPQNVQIGNGANTTLNFGSTSSFRQMLGNLLINTGSNNLTLSTSAGGDLRLGGNWINNVGASGFTANSRLVTFNGNTNAAIGGTAATTFAQIAVNKGVSTATILDVNANITISPTAVITQITNGLLRINSGATVNKTAAAGWNIASTAGLDVNGGSFSQTGASINLAGLLRISSGTATIGNLAGAHSLIYSNGSTINVSGGTLNVDARICPLTAGVSTVTYNQSGGTVNVLRMNSASTSFAAFDIGAAGSSFTWSNGNIIIDKACAFSSDYFINAATTNVTGGTLQIGNSGTPASQTIRIRSTAPVFNLDINNSSGNNPVAQLVNNNLSVNNTFTLSNGTAIDLNGRSLSLAGTINNNGGLYRGNPISNLSIIGSGAISNPFAFATGTEQLGVLTINRNGVPVTVSTNLTLNENGNSIATGSTLNNSSGTTLAIGSGSIAGISINGNLNIAGTLQLNSGGFVNGGAGLKGPMYANNSFLIYNNTGSFTRNVEWGSNTAATEGYPHHVTIQNGTTVNFTATTTFDVGCAGNLTIGHPTATNDGALVLSDMGIHDLYVNGNINIGGTNGAGALTMSNTIGGDLYLTGNWTRTNNGTVNFGSGNGRAVFFRGNSNSTITANNGQLFPFVYIDKTNIGNTVTLADHVSISDEIGFTRGTVDLGTNNRFISILSNSSKTARVAPSSAANTAFVYGASDILGQFIIQRFAPAKRSWRLITVPIDPAGGTHSISEAWQERGSPLTGLDYSTPAATATSLAADSITIDFATHITGGSTAQGFDQSPLNQSSIRWYNAGTWSAQGNINSTNVRSREGWMLFMRGDRKRFGQITNQFKPALATTLRPRGRIFIGSKTINSTGLTVVGNPYASAVDYHSTIKTGTLAGTDQYTMWDPNLGGTFGTGAFVNLTWDVPSSSYLRSAPLTGAGVSSIDNRYIPSGAAVMVDFGAGPASLTFNESDKNAANTTVAFRPTNLLQTGLYAYNEEDGHFPIDGALQVIRDGEINSLTSHDIRKINNFGENIGLLQNGHVLSIERRAPITQTDTFFYQLTQLRQRAYQLRFVFTELAVPQGLAPYAEDLHLGQRHALSLTDTTIVPFTVSDNSATARADRFRLVWKTPVQFVQLQASAVNDQVRLNWQVANEMDVVKYVVEQAVDAVHFRAVGELAAQSSDSYSLSQALPDAGKYQYRISAISSKGIAVYSNMATLVIPVKRSTWYVYPNPAQHNRITIYFTGQAAGMYEVRLLQVNGQLIYRQRIMHAGGSATHVVTPTQMLPTGNYQLELTDTKKRKTSVGVMVQDAN